ncbi:hypothetical protein [Sphingobium sp. LSP13-1-1.1]|uniref:hypothetical protein n=1 Tax=Sphingobium sp. LSP13-1-1.1 TaxID=3135234 RepID=UPI0034131E6F
MMTDQTTALQALQEQFKDGLDRDGAVALAQRVADLEEGNSGYAGKIEELTRERDDAIARAEKAEADLKAKPKVAAPKAATPRARKFKAIADDKVLSGDKLRDEISDADEIEIAFLDRNGNEIPGSKPVEVSGDVWKSHLGGLMLSEPIDLIGPSDVGYSIHGYALLIDGEHVATHKRSEAFNVAPGSRMKIENDIIF